MLGSTSEIPAWLAANRAKLVVVASTTATADIPDISVAGLPGKLAYTPPADMEVLYYGRAKCLDVMPEAPQGPPSPVILPMAVRRLRYLPTSFVDAGLQIAPRAPHIRLDARPSGSILEGAAVHAEQLLEEGQRLGREMRNDADLFLLGECVPAGTTTGWALCRGLGYDADLKFASSGTEVGMQQRKARIVDQAVQRHAPASPMEAVERLGDNMQPVLAGMAASLSHISRVVLAGGTQMLAVVALMQALRLDVNWNHLCLMTTRWIVEDAHSDFAGLAQMIRPSLSAGYADFRMQTNISNLQLYEQGLVKEGVGAGAALAWGLATGLAPLDISAQVERLYGELFP